MQRAERNKHGDFQKLAKALVSMLDRDQAIDAFADALQNTNPNTVNVFKELF
jgi:hypothetical protein